MVENIRETEIREEYIEYELQQQKIIQQIQVPDESLIRRILDAKKNSILSVDEDEKKQVLQEYVNHVVIQPSKDTNKIDAEITYRVLTLEARGVEPSS